jgi:hypothetical protein
VFTETRLHDMTNDLTSSPLSATPHAELRSTSIRPTAAAAAQRHASAAHRKSAATGRHRRGVDLDGALIVLIFAVQCAAVALGVSEALDAPRATMLAAHVHTTP